MPLLENLLSPGTIERLGWMLVHFFWQATAVALLLAVLLRLLRRVGANLRYAAACGALALMVALPVITMQFVEVSGPVAEAGPPLERPSPARVEPVPVTVVPAEELPPLEMTSPLDTAVIPASVPLRERIIATVEPALPYLVLGWLAGVFGLSAWHLGGWTQLHRLKRRMAREADVRLRATLQELAAKLGIRRAVTLLESTIVEVPTVLGWLRPVILIPASALTGLTPDQLRAILAHELAHIRRCDYLANILQTVVEILGFYHPAVWWVSSRIRIERENCCDDLAVHVCGNSLQYARALTCLEETRHSRSDLALAASGGSLMARIARLLGRPAVDDRRFAWLPGLIALLLVIGVIIPAAIVLASPNALPATHADGPEPNQVLIRFSLFPSASPNKVVDLETRNLLAGILAKENLQPLREIVHADPQQNVTLRELLETWITKRPMPPETMGVFIDVLQSRGYLEGEATPEILANDNRTARISVGSTEMLRSQTDATSPPRPVKLGTFVEVTPHVSQQPPDRIRLDLLTRWTERDDPNDRSDAPTLSTTEMTTSIAMLSDQCVALVTENTGKSDARLHMLLVSPTKVVEPQAAYTDTTAFVEVLHQNAASEPNETQIHTDWVIAKVRTETVLDRTTRRLIGDVLAAEKPQAVKELADAKQTTLGRVIREYVARQSLSQETGQALISVLKMLELATVQASPSLIAAGGRQFELRNVSEEWFSPHHLRPTQAGEEPNLIRFEYGTTIKGTARAENDASVTLDMGVWSSEPEPRADLNDLPVVRRTAASTTVNVPGDRYFSLLLESPNRESRQTQEAESLLVMVKPSVARPASRPESPSAAQPPESVKRPAQVLLDVRVIEMDRGSLMNLGIEWSFPTMQAGEFQDGNSWTKGIGLGYSADSLSTSSLLGILNRLETTGQGDIVTNPQIVAQDGGTAQLRSIREEWFFMSDPSTFLPPELQNIEAGMIMSMTPRIGDDDITLEMAIEVRESLGKGRASDLPIVTRHQAKNKVTLMSGGTVAIAGMRPVPIRPDASTTKEIAVFVTVSRISEDNRAVFSLPSKHEASSVPGVGQDELTERGQRGITGTFIDADLLSVLERIASHFKAQIAVDYAVKPELVAVELIDAPFETAMEQTLRGTPYAFKRRPEGDYLVYRPITATFEGDNLQEALRQIASMTRVPISIAPQVRGTVLAHVENVDTETALDTILAGTPYVFRRMSDYYRVGDRESLGRSRPERAYRNLPNGDGTQIALASTLIKVQANRTLDPATAAEVYDAIAPDGAPMTLENLRAATVSQILNGLADRISAEQFRMVVNLLASKRLVELVAEPQLCLRTGQPTHISGGSLTLDLRPELLDRGQTIQLDAEALVDMAKPSSQGRTPAPVASTPSLRGSGRVKIANERHGLLLLGGISSGTASATAETYYLIFRAAVVSPDMPPA